MVESVGGQGGRGQECRHQTAFFYLDDNIMALSDPGWMQGAFITLIGMFDWVVLRENAGKMVRIVCPRVRQWEPSWRRRTSDI